MDGNAATATSHVGILADLASDHARMRSLFADILATTEKERCKELFLELQALVTTHATLEERYLYPAFKAAAPTQQERWMFHQVTEEHDAADLTLQKARKAGYATEAFFGKLCALRDMVEKHAAEEEVELFPLCAEHLGPARLEEMGAKARECRERLERKGRSRRGANATRRKTARKARGRRLLTMRNR